MIFENFVDPKEEELREKEVLKKKDKYQPVLKNNDFKSPGFSFMDELK